MPAAAGDTSERDETARSGSTTTSGIHHELASSAVDRLVGLHPRKSPLTASILDSPLLRRLRETAELLDPNAAEMPRCGAGGPSCFGNFPKPKPLVKDLIKRAIPTELKAMRPLVAPAAQAGDGSCAAAEALLRTTPDDGLREGFHGPRATADVSGAGDVHLISESRLTSASGEEHPAGGVGMHDAATAEDAIETTGPPLAPGERKEDEEEEQHPSSSDLPGVGAALALQLQPMQAEFEYLTDRLQRHQEEQLALLQQQLVDQQLTFVEQQRQQQAQITALQEELAKQQLLLRRQHAPSPLAAVAGGHDVRSDSLALLPPGPLDDQLAPRTPKAPGSAAVSPPTPPSSALPVLRSRLTVDSGAERSRRPLPHMDSLIQGATHSRDSFRRDSQSAGYSTGQESVPHMRHPRGTPPMQDF